MQEQLLQEYVEQIQKMLDSYIKVMSTAIDARTPYNANHTRNMVVYAQHFLQWMEEQHLPQAFDEKKTREFIMSIWMHDIGKLITPIEIMDKQDRLADNYECIVQRFAKIRLLARIDCLEGRISPEQLQERLGQIAEATGLVGTVNRIAQLTDELVQQVLQLAARTYTEENGEITIYAKGVPAHASTPTLGVNAAGVTFECLEKAGFEDDFVTFYNTHLGTACDGSGIGLKVSDAYGDLTFCNGIVKTQDGVISCTIDIRVPVTLKPDEVRKRCEGKLEDENGRIEILDIGDGLFFPRESPLVEALYKAYVDVTGDTANEPMVIGGGTYAKSLKNIIAFGPEKLGIDYRIHGADEYILVSGMEEAVLVYMEAIKNLLAI